MPTRLNLRQTEQTRALIKANRIITRLQAFVLGRDFQKKPVVMSSEQVRAAFGLLAKILPDLTSVQHSGEITHNYVARTPHISGSVEEWTEQHSPKPTLQ